jgi:hypothetical protein
MEEMGLLPTGRVREPLSSLSELGQHRVRAIAAANRDHHAFRISVGILEL